MHPNPALEALVTAARERYVQARPLTAEAQREACRHMPGGNTRTVLYHTPFPIRVTNGTGAHLEDMDGHRYLNLLGEYTAGVFGHSHPLIRQAIDRALDNGLNLGAHNTAEPRLAELISERFPGIQSVRFTNSGTEANLMAVSTARALTQRDKVLVFKGGYHGAMLYFGGGGIPINAPFDYLVGVYNDVAALEAQFAEHGDTIACAVVETMMGSSGCIPGDPAFLHALQGLCERHGALLVLDEVMTSRFGRHGSHELLGLSPDLVTLGKWVGGGMSFGAFGGRRDLMAYYDPTREGAVPHAGTFNNNVLSMSAGIAALEQAFTSDVAQALHETGERLRGRLNALFAEHDVALQATGTGSLMNFHGLSADTRVRRVDDLQGSDDRIKELLFLALLERGVYIARRGFVALSIAVEAADIDTFEDAMEDVLLKHGATFRAAAQRAAAPDSSIRAEGAGP